VSDAIDAFIAAKLAGGLLEYTVDGYRNVLTTMLGHVTRRPVRYLVNRGVELYLRAQTYPVGHKRAGQRRSAAYHQAALERARDLGRFCVKQKWLKVNPFTEVEKIGRRNHGSDKVRLTVDESRKLYEWCLAHTDQKYAVLTFGYLLLGARASELIKRNVRDLDDGGRMLWIGKTKTLAGQRCLMIPEPLAVALTALTSGAATDAPIFTDEHGCRMSRQMARIRVLEVCAAAGVTQVSPQALRRTQATLATTAGATALDVARHLGHASTAIAERSYIDPTAVTTARTERAHLRLVR
jgi:integrase